MAETVIWMKILMKYFKGHNETFQEMYNGQMSLRK